MPLNVYETVPPLLVLLKTVIVLAFPELKLETTISGLPSPLRSPTASLLGAAPVKKSTLGLKAIVPELLLFLRIEMLFETPFTVIRSAFPSSFTSVIATAHGKVPVLKFPETENEFAEIGEPFPAKVGKNGLDE